MTISSILALCYYYCITMQPSKELYSIHPSRKENNTVRKQRHTYAYECLCNGLVNRSYQWPQPIKELTKRNILHGFFHADCLIIVVFFIRNFRERGVSVVSVLTWGWGIRLGWSAST